MQKSRQLIASIVGNLTWQPPRWVQSARRHWRGLLGVLVALLLIGGGGLQVWRWYERLPKPVTVAAHVQEPAITPVIDDKLVPQPLFIRFEHSVAPLDQMDKNPVPGIKIDPAIPGK